MVASPEFSVLDILRGSYVGVLLLLESQMETFCSRWLSLCVIDVEASLGFGYVVY